MEEAARKPEPDSSESSSCGLFCRHSTVDTTAMATDDDTLARLKRLSERLDRLRKQAQQVHALASDELRAVYANRQDREMPNLTERRAVRRS
jgi:hypothetical protein